MARLQVIIHAKIFVGFARTRRRPVDRISLRRRNSIQGIEKKRKGDLLLSKEWKRGKVMEIKIAVAPRASCRKDRPEGCSQSQSRMGKFFDSCIYFRRNSPTTRAPSSC